jgi:hypothetical protein
MLKMVSDTELLRFENSKIAANKLWQNPIQTSVFIEK